MKTKDRILATSLDLFNELGEPKVTTIDIASEMSISPGNLYYHYRNKGDIVNSLFSQFERQLLDVLEVPALDGFEWIDVWVFLSIVFDRLWDYRFIFRDTYSMLQRYPSLQNRFNRLQTKCQEGFYALISGYMRAGQISVNEVAQQTLVVQLSLCLQHWLTHYGFFIDEDPSGREVKNHGIFHLLMLLAMHMSEEEQLALLHLASSEGVEV